MSHITKAVEVTRAAQAKHEGLTVWIVIDVERVTVIASYGASVAEKKMYWEEFEGEDLSVLEGSVERVVTKLTAPKSKRKAKK